MTIAKRGVFLSVIGVCLWSAAVVAGQTSTPAALPEPLRAHLTGEKFGIVTSIRGLPLGVRDEFQKLIGSQTLEIAEPGAKFQATDVIVDPKLPRRRLVAAGCSSDHCLVYYERGGIAHTWQVVLFHWTPATTRFEWGGDAPSGLSTIDEVQRATVSGAIKGQSKYW